MEQSFEALLTTATATQYTTSVRSLSFEQLPPNDTLIEVHYSSLNYKDALSAQGNKGVTRSYPHVPGIDAAGLVVQSLSGAWQPGQRVIVTGFDLGMNTWGGLSQYVRVPGEWVISCPDELSLHDAMAWGTAGLTAGLCVNALLQAGLTPDDGPVAVSGATGGVGSLSLTILARLGFETVAITGKSDTSRAYLQETLGVGQIQSRSDFIDTSTKALLATPFAGAIDTVGDGVLSTLLRSTRYGGTVTACGMAQSPALELTVFPFILRAIRLIGIDSVLCPLPVRRQVWANLAGVWKPGNLAELTTEVTLADVDAILKTILAGQVQGRTVVRIR